jgi:hypothetical protein
MRVSRRSMRLLTVSLALALPTSMAAVAFTGSAATAANPKPSDKCKKIKVDSHNPKITLSGCKSNAADGVDQGETGGVGVLTSAGTNGTITWTGPVGSEYHNTLTDLNGETSVLVGGPGQPADEAEAPGARCPAGTQEVVLFANIGPRDTASGDVGGTFNAELCLNNATGTVTLEPGTVIGFTEGPNS